MLLDYLNLDETSDEPLYQQLYRFFCDAITGGRIAAGEHLPSIRRLAEDLRVSRTTVETAYQQLCVEGYIESRPQRGYYALTLPMAPQRSALARRQSAAPAAPAAPKLRYRFSTDSIDRRAFRVELWQKYIREVLSHQEIITAYGDHQGEPELRAALTEYTHSVRGVTTSPDRIVIGAGTQPLLFMLSGMLRRNDRMIGMESPGFPQAEQVFADCGLEICRLPGDESGIRLDALEESGVRIIYVNPTNRLGSGSPIPMTRRAELIDWATRRNALIIEDDYNGELRYSARPIPALQSIGSGENVVYLGTFSKVMLPSVRMGYMVLPPSLASLYHERSAAYNQTASRIEQLALARMIREGELEKQLRRLRKLYSAKGSLLVSCLQQEFGDNIGITMQETALRIIVCPGISATAAQLCALAAQQDVQVKPFGGSEIPGQVMLGFSGIAQEEIPEAVHRLYLAWREKI